MIKYSIIIPHYDIPQLLDRCVASIPVRKDIQVIVVDDCSPGAETYLAEYPFLSRPYLEFYSTDHGGSAGRARNVGLDHAKGVWLLFADADDFFVENMAEILDENYDRAEDIIYFRNKDVMSDDITREVDRGARYNKQIDRYILDHNDLYLRRDHYPPWAKMIKRELVVKNGIKFDNVKYCDDMMFTCRCGCIAQDIAAMDKILYCRTRRNGSLTDNFLRKEGELAICSKVLLNVQKYIKTTKYPIDVDAICKYLSINLKQRNFHYIKEIHQKLNMSYRYIAFEFLIPYLYRMLKTRLVKKIRYFDKILYEKRIQ